MNNQKIELELRDVLERVWRAKGKILLFQLAVIAVTVFVILYWPRTYASVAKLFLQVGRESVGLDPTAKSTGTTISMQQSGRDGEIKSAMDILLSRGIIAPVVDKLTPDVVLGHVAMGGPKPSPIAEMITGVMGMVVQQLRKIDPASDRERAIIEIERHLTVEAERKSEVISLTYESDSPELAQMVVQGLVDEYQTRHSNLHRIEGSTQFFDEQSQRLRGEIDVAAAALRDAKNRMGLASVEGERTSLEARINEIRNDTLMTDKLIAATEARMTNLRRQLDERPERQASAQVTKPNSAAEMQRQLLYALQIQVMDAQARLTPEHPTVVMLQDQVAKAEEELERQAPKSQEVTESVDPIHEKFALAFSQAETELVGLKARRESLSAQEETLAAKIKELNAAAIEVEQLQRELGLSERKYLTYSESREEANVDQRMQQSSLSSVKIVQAATMQEKPVSPSKPVVLFGGALMAVAGSLALAVASAQLDDRLTSAYAISKRLNLPVLGTLPQSRGFPTPVS